MLLEPGESADVALRVTHHDLTLATAGEAGGREAVAGAWTLRVGAQRVELKVA